ncbi:MAG: hypothetical protein ACRCTZ_05105 [Sarcina sp.]
MLQVKFILIDGAESLKLYSEIINEVSREYKEFKRYKINNNLEGLLLDFDVNNKYKEFNLTYLIKSEDYSEKSVGAEYSVNYFNNDKNTDVKIILDKYDEKHIRIQSVKNNKVRNVVTISQKDSIESTVYNLSTYLDNLVSPETKKTQKNLNLEILCEKILESFGIEMGYLFSRTSKNILSEDIEKTFR